MACGAEGLVFEMPATDVNNIWRNSSNILSHISHWRHNSKKIDTEKKKNFSKINGLSPSLKYKKTIQWQKKALMCWGFVGASYFTSFSSNFSHFMSKVRIIFLSTFHLLILVLGQLHKNVHYYETLHADDFTHKVVKRGTKHSSHPFNTIKEVEFKALGRNFRLILHPNREVLHHNFKAYSVDGNGKEKIIHFDQTDLYQGRVFGEMQSHVHAHIENGVLTATVTLPGETYHIEPSWRHLPHLTDKHMVAYRSSDVKLSWDQKDPNMSAPMPCGFVKEGLELETNDDDDDDDGDNEVVNHTSFWQDTHQDAEQSGDQPEPEVEALLRKKRQADQYEYTPTKTRCPLLLVADYRFFSEMGASSTKTTINYLISLIDRVHKIYNDTIWQDRSDQDGFKGMGFVIKKIVVHSDPTRVRGGEAHYNMVRDKWDVRNLLEVSNSHLVDA